MSEITVVVKWLRVCEVKRLLRGQVWSGRGSAGGSAGSHLRACKGDCG